ncbi:NADH:ubiquinone oxidoreductase chain G-like protein [Opitutaceae bacterium TAV1]|nr:NADH:ubiquinone oxidoreductase chain G-like protein [Opitutaceae bacterium TAV1]
MTAAAPAKPDLITVNIDGKEVAVPKGTNVIEAARLVGVDVPHYCYHPKLSVVGNCRMCLIEMGLPAVDPATKTPVIDPATGKQKINWMPRPQIGCGTNAIPGLHIRTTTQMVRDAREGVMEFLLINHPLDCPICDQAGECKLQEQATGYGRGYSRFIEEKNVKPKRTRLGPRVTLDDERCILCSRCVRFSKEIARDDVLGFVDRGSYSTLTCYPGRELANNYSLNTVDICPVGALTSTDFRFKMRVWFLKQTNSIDTESSVGANTVVWSREGVIYRITPRRNDAVNDTWMTDSGRLLYKQVAAENRLSSSTPLDDLVAQAAGLVARASSPCDDAAGVASSSNPRAGSPCHGLALVASTRSSVEEQYLAKKLSAALGNAPVHLPAHLGEGDGILLSADRAPNTRGALVTGLVATLPAPKLASLAADIDAGKVKTLLVINEDLTTAGLTADQLGKVAIIYLGTHANATSTAAKVVLPTLTVFEKAGSFINQQFRLQAFAKAVPGLAGAHDDLLVLTKLLAAVSPSGAGVPPASGDTAGVTRFPSSAPAPLAPTLAAVRESLAAEVPALAGLARSALPDTGLVLDAAPWSALPFPEGASLHYKPATT